MRKSHRSQFLKFCNWDTTTLHTKTEDLKKWHPRHLLPCVCPAVKGQTSERMRNEICEQRQREEHPISVSRDFPGFISFKARANFPWLLYNKIPPQPAMLSTFSLVCSPVDFQTLLCNHWNSLSYPFSHSLDLANDLPNAKQMSAWLEERIRKCKLTQWTLYMGKTGCIWSTANQSKVVAQCWEGWRIYLCKWLMSSKWK